LFLRLHVSSGGGDERKGEREDDSRKHENLLVQKIRKGGENLKQRCWRRPLLIGGWNLQKNARPPLPTTPFTRYVFAGGSNRSPSPASALVPAGARSCSSSMISPRARRHAPHASSTAVCAISSMANWGSYANRFVNAIACCVSAHI